MEPKKKTPPSLYQHTNKTLEGEFRSILAELLDLGTRKVPAFMLELSEDDAFQVSLHAIHEI